MFLILICLNLLLITSVASPDTGLCDCCAGIRSRKNFDRFPVGWPMDELDEAIVGLLERDGRITHRDIAQRVGLSRSAAAARVQRLMSAWWSVGGPSLWQRRSHDATTSRFFR